MKLGIVVSVDQCFSDEVWHGSNQSRPRIRSISWEIRTAVATDLFIVYNKEISSVSTQIRLRELSAHTVIKKKKNCFVMD